MFAFEREPLNTLIAAVSDIQYWFGTTRIQNDSVRALELTGLFARTTEGTYVFTLAVVLEDVTRAIAVANIDISVWRHCQVGRTVLQGLSIRAGLCVSFGLLGITQREDLLAVQRGLHHQATLNVAQI